MPARIENRPTLPKRPVFFMPDFSQISPNSLPVWVVVALLLINLFREPLSASLGKMPDAIRHMFQQKAKADDDQREFEQRIAEAKTDVELQSKAYREMRENLIDQELVQIVNKQLEHILDQDALKTEQNTKILEELQGVRRALLRTADVLAATYSAAIGKNGGVILKVSGDIEAELEGGNNGG